MRPPGFPDNFPVTFAVRGLHLGRYGPDSESGRLFPLYLGYGTLVRGYSSGSFTSDTSYNEFLDRLFGSRLAIEKLFREPASVVVTRTEEEHSVHICLTLSPIIHDSDCVYRRSTSFFTHV